MMIIAVDTGNRCIKVPDIAPFTAGVYCNGKTPPIATGETIFYEGQYYTLSNSRCEYMRDKTENNTYFILMLFAVARRICAKQPGMTSYDKEVVLCMGLPPSHLNQEMKDKYKAYFSNKGVPIEFLYNDVPFRIHIAYPEEGDVSPQTLRDPRKCGVCVFAQGYAAAMLRLSDVVKTPESYIIDIGGYTTDVVKLGRERSASGFRMVVEQSQCESLNMGVIHLFNAIKKKIGEQVGDGISETIIDSILQHTYKSNDTRVNEIVQEESKAYASLILSTLADKGYRFTFSQPIFIGGGANVLQQYLVDVCPNAIFIPQLTANAEGYAKLTTAYLKRYGMLNRDNGFEALEDC